MVFEQADAAGHEQLIHVQVADEVVLIAAGGVVEAQEVELDAEELRDKLAEAVEQHLRRHVEGC